MQPSGRHSPTATSGEGLVDALVPWALAAAAVVVAATWSGAALAAAVTGHSPVDVHLADSLQAFFRLPSRLSDPASAWPPASSSALPGAVLYWVAQLVAVAALAVLAVGAARLVRAHRDGKASALGVRTDAGFARRADVNRLAVREPVPGRLTLGRGAGRLLAAEAQASLAVVGPTGCGKTAGFAIPALLEWQGPVIATSVKNDLLEATLQHRQRRGRVWVYDPTRCSGHPAASWSPLAACTTWAGAMRTAAWMAEAAQPRLDTVSDGDYWYSQARKGLAPYLYAAATSGRALADVIRWVDGQEIDQVESALRAAADKARRAESEVVKDQWDDLWVATVGMTRDLLRTSGGGSQLADAPADQWPEWVQEQLSSLVDREWRAGITASGRGVDPLAPVTAARALWAKEPRLRGSVFATMENVLAGWADPGVTGDAACNDVDLDAWLAGDNTIYVVATAHEQHRLRPVLTTLVQQAIRNAYDAAARNGGQLVDPCLVLLDEAGNIAPLRDLPGYASTARSHNITLVTVWQDLAQLRAVYRDRAQTVLNNHRARLFGTGIADKETLEYVSGLIGDERRTEHNVSADLGGGRRTVSEYRTYRRAAPVDVLRRVRVAEAVLLYGSELPVHLKLRPWFEDASLLDAAGRPDLIQPRRSRARLRR